MVVVSNSFDSYVFLRKVDVFNDVIVDRIFIDKVVPDNVITYYVFHVLDILDVLDTV